ncbi:hypothetical protein MBELCI_1912 [Limimaricola cinnabarinus LL-001]|uniref:Uncharacterized protein n=1 Tax=Limimaricola cinnabarinus LL-001 TaxID=1337093 RepID=U2Z3C8_9RHOB|nr:hypothetical protein MBELCI_1912 [Limimaricola cinnabarinus LL-001]
MIVRLGSSQGCETDGLLAGGRARGDDGVRGVFHGLFSIFVLSGYVGDVRLFR